MWWVDCVNNVTKLTVFSVSHSLLDSTDHMERWIVYKPKDGETLGELRDWICDNSSKKVDGVAVRTNDVDVTGDRKCIVLETSEKLEKQRAASKRQVMRLYEEKEELIAELNAIKRKIKELDMEDLFFSQTKTNDNRTNTKTTTTTTTTRVRCEGDGKFPQIKSHIIENAHGSSNVLVVKFNLSTSLIASGGVDFFVRVFSSQATKKYEELSSIKLSAPVLALDWCPTSSNLLAASCMDGSLHLLTYEIETNKLVLKCSSKKHHDKYVVAIRWSSNGKYLATASHDHTAILFSLNPHISMEKKKEWDEIFTRVQRFCLESAVEDVTFITMNKKENLIVAERSSVYLHVVDLNTLQIKDMNVNERDDTHLSFSILAVVPSPDESMLCLATDSDQLVVLESSSGKHICTLVGHKCGQYAQPSVCWDSSGDYIYSNSQKDTGIYVWSLATQRVVKRLSEHTKQVRSIDMHMSSRRLVSGSFDKSICTYI